MVMKNNKTAILYALASVLFWSTAGTAFKLTLRELDVASMLLLSSGFAVLVLAVFVSKAGHWKAILSSSRTDILHSATLGFLNPFLYYMVLLYAYDILLAQEAIVLNYTWPLVLVLLSIPVLKQHPGWKGLGALFISFLGTVVVVTRGDIAGLQFSEPLGIGMAAASALIWGLFWVFNTRDKRDELQKLFLNFFFGFIYTLIFIILRGDQISISLTGWLGTFYIGLFEMGITFVLWLRALQFSTSTARVTNLIYISPFISLILVGLILGEHIYPATIVGLVMIIGGIFLQQRCVTRDE
jgi:drug/metabolite transporter (DMT)-like permease